jgi:uncharacterized repeat protein (TIGR03803 family)
MKRFRRSGSFGFQLRLAAVVMTVAAVIVAAVFIAHSAGATQAKQSVALTTLYSFTGSPDGAYPTASLLRDAQGRLYGTTEAGGNTGCYIDQNRQAQVGAGCGTVYRLDPAGKETVLYTFTGGADGGIPVAGLITEGDGKLYGTTVAGGTSQTCNGYIGCGVVFSLSPPAMQGAPWSETVLYTFTGGADGGTPFASLITDGDGNLYGTTFSEGSHGGGVVFEVDSSGNEIVLYTFCAEAYCQDGANPQASLVRDPDGNLYGTTDYGGSMGSYGVVFKLDPSGNETVIYAFTGGTDGAYPGELLQGATGNFYGTTTQGGNHSDCNPSYGHYGCGVVFELGAAGEMSTLYKFKGGTDGEDPNGNLIRDREGRLYGTTGVGGAYDQGTIFVLGKTGMETVLYTFTGKADGLSPAGGLIADGKGNLYGTTAAGGVLGCLPNPLEGCGTVFELSLK